MLSLGRDWTLTSVTREPSIPTVRLKAEIYRETSENAR